MRPIDSYDPGEGPFEMMMGMTPADWEALGPDETEDDRPVSTVRSKVSMNEADGLSRINRSANRMAISITEKPRDSQTPDAVIGIGEGAKGDSTNDGTK